MTLQCGRPNLTMVTQEEDSRTRHKRVVGGVPAKPVGNTHTFSHTLTNTYAHTHAPAHTLPCCGADPNPVAGGHPGQWQRGLWRSIPGRVLGPHCCSRCQGCVCTWMGAVSSFCLCVWVLCPHSVCVCVCVLRPRPNNFMVKFSVWKKRSPQGTTDIVPVKEIHIHYK